MQHATTRPDRARTAFADRRANLSAGMRGAGRGACGLRNGGRPWRGTIFLPIVPICFVSQCNACPCGSLNLMSEPKRSSADGHAHCQGQCPRVARRLRLFSSPRVGWFQRHRRTCCTRCPASTRGTVGVVRARASLFGLPVDRDRLTGASSPRGAPRSLSKRPARNRSAVDCE